MGHSKGSTTINWKREMWIRNSYLVFPLQWQRMLKLYLVGSIHSHNWISLEVSHTVRKWMRSRHSIGPLMNLKDSHSQHIVPRRCISSRDNRMYICVTHTHTYIYFLPRKWSQSEEHYSFNVSALGMSMGRFLIFTLKLLFFLNDFTKSRTILNMAALTVYKVCKSCHSINQMSSLWKLWNVSQSLPINAQDFPCEGGSASFRVFSTAPIHYSG